jgi:alpha-glucuronidase
MMMRKRAAALLVLILSVPLTTARADDGYRLWLRYDQISDRPYLKQCTRSFSSVMITGDRGVLYGAFRLLRVLGTRSSPDDISLLEKPATVLRLLNHWDNLDGSVERGYAGSSIWNWHLLPGPWVDRGRPDWTSVYYHRADTAGIGFDRTRSGSNAVSQYFPPLAGIFNEPQRCPEELLLWFHHLPRDYRMKSGKTLWEELCLRYDRGVRQVEGYRIYWETLNGQIDDEQYDHVRQLLAIQAEEARWWRDACLAYFRVYSRRDFPEGVEKPERDADYYRGLKFYYVPGI